MKSRTKQSVSTNCFEVMTEVGVCTEVAVYTEVGVYTEVEVYTEVWGGRVA